jgi:hypothetical protein
MKLSSRTPFIPTLTFANQTRFITILFVDALQRMLRITTEVETAKTSGQGIQDVRAETSIAARKF